MTKYNNYLRKDPFSSFSQLNIEPFFYKNVLVPIIKSLYNPIQNQNTAHLYQEYSITTFINALLGYSQNTGTQILERKLNSILKGNTKKFIKRTRILPHPSQMNSYTREFSMEDADSILIDINKDVLIHLLKHGIIKKKIKIAFDFKKLPYYGKKNNPYAIGIKSEKGTNKALKWHTCAIVLKGFELQIGSEMVKKGDKKELFIQRMVEYFESLGFIVELVVMDREYYNKSIFKYLESKGIKYITPVKDSKKLKALKEKALKNPKKRVQNYNMRDGYVKGKGYKHIKFKIAFFGKKKVRFDRLRTKYRNNSKNLTDILSDIFVLASNQVVHPPSVKKKYKFYKLREEYGDRWRIETSYREENPFIMYSTSRIPEVRNLYFIIALLLYNLWVIANILLHKKKPWQKKEPKAFLMVYFNDIILSILQLYMGLDPPYSEFCREEELKIMGCMII